MIQWSRKFPYCRAIEDANSLSGGTEIWYGDVPYYVKLVGIPGTLAGDILRLKSDLDFSEEVAKLPLIAFDPEKHFKKSTTYKQEIRYLLQCRGSPRIVQLLGRTEEGALVFPKFKRSFMETLLSNKDQGRMQNIRRWMVEVIDGVACLHSLGIIHRDLNILESDPLVICDLQCLHSTYHCQPFEIDGGDYGNFSFASDVFALGALLWESCFYNAPYSRDILLDNPPPPPFRDIFVACTQEKPEDRSTLTQLRVMYEAIR